MSDRRVRGRDVFALGAVAAVALLACASSTPYMELPQQDQDMYDACREDAVDWCLETQFGAPKLRSDADKSVASAQDNLRRAEARKKAVDEHFDECNGAFMEDGIARTEYVGKGNGEQRKAWLLSIGCTEAKMAKAKDQPKPQ
ncbi:MAG: hypothetical protein AB7S68_36980 [Polyangiaceae bacterium]